MASHWLRVNMKEYQYKYIHYLSFSFSLQRQKNYFVLKSFFPDLGLVFSKVYNKYYTHSTHMYCLTKKVQHYLKNSLMSGDSFNDKSIIPNSLQINDWKSWAISKSQLIWSSFKIMFHATLLSLHISHTINFQSNYILEVELSKNYMQALRCWNVSYLKMGSTKVQLEDSK